MLSSRFAGIPISSSLIDVAGVPQLLTCGEQTLRAKNPAQLSGFISEWCPASNRKPVRLQIGNSVRLASEFARRIHGARGKRTTVIVIRKGNDWSDYGHRAKDRPYCRPVNG
jgi:hypothetical protein